MQRAESIEKTGEQLTRKGEEFIDKASDKAREATETVANTIAEASETIQGRLRETGKEVGEVVNAVSEKVRSSAQYLEDSSVQDVVEDVTVLIKRYPIHAILIGAGIGFLLARGRTR
ncbi:MAG: hypothetical protein JSS38_07495 [Nitrospira sp.]|nr:hypothetical protein [Nitrospira sp.]